MAFKQELDNIIRNKLSNLASEKNVLVDEFKRSILCEKLDLPIYKSPKETNQMLRRIVKERYEKKYITRHGNYYSTVIRELFCEYLRIDTAGLKSLKNPEDIQNELLKIKVELEKRSIKECKEGVTEITPYKEGKLPPDLKKVVEELERRDMRPKDALVRYYKIGGFDTKNELEDCITADASVQKVTKPEIILLRLCQYFNIDPSTADN